MVGVIHSSIDQCVPSAMLSRPEGTHIRWAGLGFYRSLTDILFSLFFLLLLEGTKIEALNNSLTPFQPYKFTSIVQCSPSTSIIPLQYNRVTSNLMQEKKKLYPKGLKLTDCCAPWKDEECVKKKKKKSED